MFKKILVPIDLAQPDASAHSLERAAKVAEACGADLELLSVLGEVPSVVAVHMPPDYLENASATAQAQLRDLAAALDLAEDRVTVSARHGSPYREILEAAEQSGADLIVIASHKPGAADYLLGSVAAKVVRHASCSVLVDRS